jgi:lysine/ornithine N-monooxygenase
VLTSEALIIGAGPFGLSISAHLSELGVDHVIAGRTMDTYRTHCPAGMNMKSEPYASDIASPKPGYRLMNYCQAKGLDYVNRVGPVPLDQFLGYSDWYAEQLVPGVRDITATQIDAVNGGFRVAFAEADPVTVRQVVLATGVLPYAHIPAELSGLSPDLATHTQDHHDLGRFKGRRVAVVGGGQSALETAALLHENGAEVEVVMRRPKVQWNDPNPAELSRLGHIKRPVTQLCEGWHCAFWNTPAAFRRLPLEMRITKAKTVLGPAGSWWLKDRIDGVFDVLTGHRVKEAMPEGSGVRLILDGPKQSSIDVDHVIAGTGFRVDPARLPFLPEGLRGRIATINGHPVVSLAGESTVGNLYFVGAPTVISIGPSSRFIAGTHNTVPKLTKLIARRAKARGGRPAPSGASGRSVSQAASR